MTPELRDQREGERARAVCCPACGAEVQRPLFSVRDYHYLRCDVCESATLDEWDSDAADLYNEDYFTGVGEGGYLGYDDDAGLHARNAVARLAIIDGCGPPIRRLIDVGCASGFVLDEARVRGAEVLGVDISSHARGVAGARGHTVVASLETAAAELPSPDVISFFQSLEHIADPDAAVTKAVELLGPGGRLVIETWNRTSYLARLLGKNWQQANPPTVVHLFSQSGIEMMLQQHGLTIEVMRATPKWVSLGLVAGIASYRWPRIGQPLLALARKARLAGVPIYYPLHDLITVVARKPGRDGD